MIKATNLTKDYGEQRAVDIPELIIPDGTILGLVGNNGAGKTTLFRLILDLIKATDGEIGLSKSDDEELIRFDVYAKHIEGFGDDWTMIDDASYCTTLPVNTPIDELKKKITVVFKEYKNVQLHIQQGGSVKKLGETLSWI